MKHNYQLEEAVKIYEDSHYISSEIKKKIADYIFSNIYKKDKKLTLLDAGIGRGDLVLLPLINKLMEENFELEVIGIDNSEPMVSKLGESLKNLGFKYIKDSNCKKWEKNNCTVCVYFYDLEEYLVSKVIRGKEFDIILSILTLHHLKNWRLVLCDLLKYLKPNGIFVIFEWTKGIKLRDGNFINEDGTEDNFKEIDEEIKKFWENFYKQRKEYHLWYPEICASNYSMVKKVIRKIPSIEEISEDFEWKERKCINWRKVKNWIEKKAYSNFYRGLSSEEQEKLLEWVERELNNIKGNKRWEEALGCKITIFRLKEKFPDEKIYKIILSSLYETPIYSKIIWENKYTDLLRFATLLIQHDFISENTIFFTLNKWNMVDETWDINDKPMIFNKLACLGNNFLSSLLLYYQIIEKLKISATDLIFRHFKQKPILTIKKGSNWECSKTVDNKRDILKIEIILPNNQGMKIDVNSIFKNNICDEKYWNRTDLWKPIKEEILNLNFGKINQEIVKNIDFEKLDKFIDNFFNKFSKDIQAGKKSLENILLNGILPSVEQLEDFVKILLLHMIIPDWDIVTYINAQTILKQMEKSETELLLSLGGIIIFEKLGENSDLINKFLEVRTDVLKTIISLKFRSIGIEEYSRKLISAIKPYALRSVVAAVMARNMAHNIDSHITPRATVEAVRKRLKELGFQEDLDTIQLLKGRLDKYRQERSDFLAEITSEPLTTTKSILFYREVILPLIENVLFMDNIARNEGICYRNTTNNRLRIRVFFEDTELKANYICATSPGLPNTQPYSITYPDQDIPYTAHCINCSYQSPTENHTEKPSELVGIPCQTTDIEIELPGPVGEHAFYGFLENFIRNAAKHNRQYFDDNSEENLEVNIRISEPQDEQERKEFYVIEIWDNVTDPNKSVNAEVDGKKCETLYDLIQAYIESDVIDESGKKKEQAYGITEMKVNAMLLRGSTDFMRIKEFLEVSRERRKATQWFNGQYHELEKERLIYRFRLMKAKKI